MFYLHLYFFCRGDSPQVAGDEAVDSSRGYNADLSHAVRERLASLLLQQHLRKHYLHLSKASLRRAAADPPSPPAGTRRRLGVRAARRCWELRFSWERWFLLLVVVVLRGQRQS